METKVCKFCGVAKPLSAFRHYYNGRRGTYTYCLDCEKIEARRKYLNKRYDKCTEQQKQELRDIEKLYEARVANGLSAPGRSGKSGPTVSDLVSQQLSRLTGDSSVD